MKQKLHLFSWLLLTVALLMPVKTMAQVVIDNITYTFSGTEATVTKISPLPTNLVIPPTVTYNGVTYNVTSLENFNTSGIAVSPTSITATSIKKIFTSDNYLLHSRLLYNQQNLSSVSFPALETIDGLNVFSGLSKLATLSLPSLTTIGENAARSIDGLPILTSLNMPKLSVIDGVFCICDLAALTSLSLPELTTVGGHDVMQQCSALTSLDVHKLSQIKDQAHWFLRETNLSEITFADGCEIGRGWGFLAWSHQENITVKGLTKINGQNFILSHSESTKHVYFPDLVEMNGGSIGHYHAEMESFDAPKLEKINNVGNFLNYFAFDKNSQLTSVNLPSLKEISGSTLFSNAPLLTLKLRGDLQVDASSTINLKTYPTVVTITDEGTVNDIPASCFANVKGGRFIAPKGKAGMYATKWNLNIAKTMVYSPVEINKSTASTLYASGSITKADASFTYGGTTYKNQYDVSHAMTAAECLDPSVLSDNDLGFTPTLTTQTVQNGTNALAGYSFYYASAYNDAPTRKLGDLTLTALPTTAVSTLQGFNATATSLNQGISRDLGGFLFKGNNASVTEVYLPYTPTATTVTTNYLKAGEGNRVQTRQNNSHEFYWHPGDASFTMGFYESYNVLISEYRSYLSIAKTLTSNAKRFNLIFEDGQTTGINTVNMSADDNSATSSDVWYTLQGTRLPAKPTAAGIYINGGRKVVIK